MSSARRDRPLTRPKRDYPHAPRVDKPRPGIKRHLDDDGTEALTHAQWRAQARERGEAYDYEHRGVRYRWSPTSIDEVDHLIEDAKRRSIGAKPLDPYLPVVDEAAKYRLGRRITPFDNPDNLP